MCCLFVCVCVCVCFQVKRNERQEKRELILKVRVKFKAKIWPHAVLLKFVGQAWAKSGILPQGWGIRRLF